MKARTWVAIGLLALTAFMITAATGSAAPKATFTAALISDVGKFNDKSFNQDQLAGLKRAQKQLGVSILPIQSNSSSDYLPNLTTAVRRGAQIVSAAGYLLAPTLSQIAPQFPKVDFTITDDSVKGPDFAKAKSVANVMGLTFASNEAGCLVGYLAAEMVKKQGGKQVIGAVGGIKIPSVDDYIVGYKYCAKLYNPKITVVTGYSQDFVAQDKCKTVAQNQIGQGSQVEFQVAGGCGLGVLDAAKEKGIWGIGVDSDQSFLGPQILTSAIKKVNQGVYETIERTQAGKYRGNWNLVLGVRQGGSGIGKISSKVPKAIQAKVLAV